MKKDRRFEIRLSKDEEEYLEKKAAELGESPTDYIRSLVFPSLQRCQVKVSEKKAKLCARCKRVGLKECSGVCKSQN